MNCVSKTDWRALWRTFRPAAVLAALVAVSIIAGACVSLVRNGDHRSDRGIIYSHEVHAALELDCTICHSPDPDRPGALTMPGHPVCSVCHDIPEDTPSAESCAMCHTRADYSVTPVTARFSEDIIFAHDPHIAAEVSCSVCHENLDGPPLPRGPLKNFCMDCHGDTSPALNECSVCHVTMDRDVLPRFRVGGGRVAHDALEIWKKAHGHEAHVDPQFCALCHTSESYCDECHRVNEPDDHTVSFKRRIHGLQAGWDRQRCAVCHEEDSCIRCHQNSTPASHHGGWGSPGNRHCVSCHYPPERNNCTVCHEEVNHRSAMPSPHTLGIYPPNCALCHPGGVPYRAPHLLNSSVRCIVCHR